AVTERREAACGGDGSAEPHAVWHKSLPSTDGLMNANHRCGGSWYRLGHPVGKLHYEVIDLRLARKHRLEVVVERVLAVNECHTNDPRQRVANGDLASDGRAVCAVIH